MPTCYTSGGSVVDIETRLNQYITAWYPGMAGSRSVLVFREEKEYRWSRHLLYDINCAHDLPTAGILVKQPKLRDSSGRLQFEVLTSEDPLVLEFQALSLVYEHLQGGDAEGITAVRPLAHFPDLNALVLEYLPGQHLHSLLLGAGGMWAKPSVVQDAVSASYAGGILLSNVHQIGRNGYPKRDRFDVEGYVRRLEGNVDLLLRLVANAHFSRRLLLAKECLERCLHGIGETGIVSHLHGDLYPENLVRLPDGQVYTVDTTLHQVGPIEDDIAKFIVGVSSTKRRLLVGPIAVRRSTVDAMSHAFLAGYGIAASFSPRILLLCTLLAYLRRWSEVIFALKRTTLPVLGSAIQLTRIDPFMLACVESIWSSIKQEFKLS